MRRLHRGVLLGLLAAITSAPAAAGGVSAGALLAAAPSAAAAPAARVTAGSAPGNSYELTQLAPGVYAAVRRVLAGTEDGNTLFIINDTDVVVVDSGGYASDARQMIAEIRKRTAKPVRYVINTHHHGDHVIGNQIYREAFPGVEFIAQTKTRDLAIADGGFENLVPAFRKEIADADTKLAAGKTSEGTPLTAERRAHIQMLRSNLEFWLHDNAGIQRISPTLTVEHDLVLHRGNRDIEVRFLGAGHTPGDVVVYLPRERILATGDLVVLPIPFGYGADFRDWPTTLRALKRLDAAVIVPGHGEIQRDWSYVDRELALVESTWDQVKRAVESGADLDATRKAVDGDALSKAFGLTSRGEREEFDWVYLDPAIETAFAALH